MADENKERKDKIQELIGKWTPLRQHGVKLSLSFPPRTGFMVITHKKPIIGTTKEFIEGLLVGAGLAPSYFPDSGPFDCQTPAIEWKGPENE